jgi:hypothetical protein
MEHINYKRLYALQDEILDLVFNEDTEFYLTGGTCLNRFYFEKRYSDDLDFFTHHSNTFSYSSREVIERIAQAGLPVDKLVDEKDFIRIGVTKDLTFLQIDFINDRVPRFGELVIKKGYKLDNTLNILSNKLTAVIGRDNPKDVFDIALITENCLFNWSEILAETKKKLLFQKEDLLYRLQTFPRPLLKRLKLTDEHCLDTFEQNLAAVILAIQECH